MNQSVAVFVDTVFDGVAYHTDKHSCKHHEADKIHQPTDYQRIPTYISAHVKIVERASVDEKIQRKDELVDVVFVTIILPVAACEFKQPERDPKCDKQNSQKEQSLLREIVRQRPVEI